MDAIIKGMHKLISHKTCEKEKANEERVEDAEEVMKVVAERVADLESKGEGKK